MFFTPRPCEFARTVQLLRLGSAQPPGPIQVIYQGEAPIAAPRGRRQAEDCPPRRATDPGDGGAVRTARLPEQLSVTMPPSAPRLWEAERTPPQAAGRQAARTRRGRKEPPPAPPEPQAEGVAPRNPIAVAGRDWAGDPYTYVFLLAVAGGDTGNRRVQILARTYDFEHYEIRSRGAEGYGIAWAPFGEAPDAEDDRRRRKGRESKAPENPSPTAVLDEAGRPLIGNCPGAAGATQGLSGSISVVDQTYHYFYTDVMPEDCNEAPLKQRTALYLRTSRDLSAERVWSLPRTIAEPLPPGIFVRVGKAKGMDRWVVSYTCNRPANAPGGPISDLCLQYTTDLSVGAIAGLTWYAEPRAAMRSPTYLGLRAGGDGGGRYGRAAHYWMTDRYGNLDTPGLYSVKAGFLTWLDRTAPRVDGTTISNLYGRPIYWATWSVRPVGSR
ncbi:hypothetical protein [Methylobacterium sp. A54F]